MRTTQERIEIRQQALNFAFELARLHNDALVKPPKEDQILAIAAKMEQYMIAGMLPVATPLQATDRKFAENLHAELEKATLDQAILDDLLRNDPSPARHRYLGDHDDGTE